MLKEQSSAVSENVDGFKDGLQVSSLGNLLDYDPFTEIRSTEERAGKRA